MADRTDKLQQITTALKPLAVSVGVISFFINLLILPMSIYALQVFDRVISTGSLSTLFWLTLIMFIMFAAAGWLQSLRSIILQRSGDWLHGEISEEAMPLVLAQTSGGGKGAQHLRDANSLKQFISGNGLVAIIDTPWSILYIAVLFIVHWVLGIIVLTGAVLLVLMAWLNETAIKRPNHEAGLRHTQAMQELELATRNSEVTQAMGMSEALATRWLNLQKSAATLQILAGGRASIIQGITKFIRLSLQVLVTAISAWLAVEGHVTSGAIIAASILASRALAPFEAAISSWKSFVDARASYSRLKKIFTDSGFRNESIALPVPNGIIEVENLSYSAADREEPILNNISFKLAAGESLGIIGASGSGKSTLARLIMGIYPADSGNIRLDGADVYRWQRKQFGEFVGYLPQDVELFGGSVKENISRFNPDATPESIIRAAQMANAHDLILRLPKGYETEIGASGGLLSAGQRQRIGLARAFYGMPKFLLLDEPDANLDDAGQQALLAAIHIAKQQKITLILITHRRLFLSNLDKLLVLRDGAVENFGRSAEIIASYENRQKIHTAKG